MSEIPLTPIASHPAIYKGHPRYGFRGGAPAEIIGVRMLDLKYGTRACFMVLYPDGYVDYCPVEDINSYTITGRES